MTLHERELGREWECSKDVVQKNLLRPLNASMEKIFEALTFMNDQLSQSRRELMEAKNEKERKKKLREATLLTKADARAKADAKAAQKELEHLEAETHSRMGDKKRRKTKLMKSQSDDDVKEDHENDSYPSQDRKRRRTAVMESQRRKTKLMSEDTESEEDEMDVSEPDDEVVNAGW